LNEAREDGYDIAAVQKLLGHRDVRSTMIYAHAPEPGVLHVVSLIDAVIGPGGAVAPRALELGRVASPPIARDDSSMQIEHRRANENLPVFEGAAAMQHRPRGSPGERD